MRTSDVASANALRRMQRFGHAEAGEPQDFHLTGTAAVAEVEQKLRSWYGATCALCVSNATDALRAIALAIELKNVEFITTPLTWGGSIAEWLELGNHPRFARVDPLTLTLSPRGVRDAITAKTKAILAVDMFGNPADMLCLREIADEHDLWLIADASQSIGAKRDGLPASAAADAVVLSFGTGKGVEAGDGGAVITNNRSLYEKIVWVTQHPSRQRLALGIDLENEFAFNSRMNPWTAIWLAATFDEQLANVRRQQAAITRYLSTAKMSRLVTTAIVDPSLEPSFQRVVGRWRNGRRHTDELLRLLDGDGWRAALEPLERRLLFNQPSFAAQYANRASGVLDKRSLGVDLADYLCLALRRSEVES
jgi:perosamine synthetase